MASYDEDLTANDWYISLCGKHEDLFARASSERWMICIPRNGTWKAGIDDGDLFTQKYFESHILKPVVVYSSDKEEGNVAQNKYMTFNGKEVSIEGSKILCGNGFSNMFQKPSYDSRSETLDLQIESCHSSEILFEETFFNQNDESYVVLCISQPLESELVLQKKNSDIGDDSDSMELQPPKSLWDQYGTFIWGKASNATRCRNIVNEKITQFNNDQMTRPYSYTQMAKNEKAMLKEVSTMSDGMLKLLTSCYQLLRKDFKLKKFCDVPAQNEEFQTTLENYVQHDVHDSIMGKLRDLLSFQDFHFNKITRNLLSIGRVDLEIQEQFWIGVPRARRELSLLNHFHTPSEKLACIQKAVMFLSQKKPFASSSAADHIQQEVAVLSSDDLLPILVYLVIKCDIANWLANLFYLKFFQFKKTAQDKSGFYLATLEAAIEHVRQGNVNIDAAKVLQRQNSTDDGKQLMRLFMLIRDGDKSGVQRFLRQAESLRNLHEHDKCHPLCECAKCLKLTQGNNGHGLKSQVSVTTRDDKGRCALHIAATTGKHELVDVLVEFGADLNATDYHGCTPLHSASAEGSQSVMFLLLHHGANANAEDNNNNTPLHLACLGGHEGCVKALLYFDPISVIVKINPTNDCGDTPLHIAAKWGYVKIVQALMEYQANPKLKNRKNLTPFDVSHNSDVTNTLRTTELDLNAVSRYRDPPKKKSLHRSFTLATATVSAEREGKSKSKTKRGSTDDGDNTEKQVEKLLRAVQDNDTNMVSFLCGWSAAENAQDGNTEKCHPLCQCSKCKPPLLDTVLHANITGPDGNTPLMLASKLGYVEMVELLLEHNAKTDTKIRVKGHTPLHFACQYDHVEIVKLLLKHGAYYDIRDSEGNTPIFMAAMNGHCASISVLLEYGASVNIRNHKRDSPLHEAVKWRHGDTVRLLVDNGAKVYYKNNLNKTPCDWAETEPEIFEILTNAKSSQPLEAAVEHVTTDSSNRKAPDSLSRKSISQSEADEALANELYDKFNDLTPSTPPLYEVISKVSSNDGDDVIESDMQPAVSENCVENKDTLKLFEQVSDKLESTVVACDVANTSVTSQECVETNDDASMTPCASGVEAKVSYVTESENQVLVSKGDKIQDSCEVEDSKPPNTDSYFEITSKLCSDVLDQIDDVTASQDDVDKDCCDTAGSSDASYLCLNNKACSDNS
uniref:Ankyrin repeat domain-containing protein 27-like n=1 Tax=Phallusia mammillata TaxID=59560 RepID=A0A6F9D5V4_9ASCI|nr:ankyrin repeat domain-containing protein 27-like [Phallusia mammillata]